MDIFLEMPGVFPVRPGERESGKDWKRDNHNVTNIGFYNGKELLEN